MTVRVLFLTLYPEAAASPRYRVHQFLPHLRAAGIAAEVASPLGHAHWQRFTSGRHRAAWYHVYETPARLMQLLRARRYAVVVVQKALTTPHVRGFGALLRRVARRVVYDIDDAVYLAAPHALRGPWRALVQPRQITWLARHSDLVLAGNRWLADAMQAAGAPRVVHFPTVVDETRFLPAPHAPDALRLVWMGSPSTTPHLRVAADALRDVPGLAAHLYGAAPEGLDWPGATLHPWRLETEVAALQQATVGIMPLTPGAWTRGKCALKALQYMACGLPCVATPFGAVGDIIRHNENGLFAQTPAEWRAAMAQLGDPAERARLGEAGRATVVADYSLAQAAPRLTALLREVAS